MKKGQIHIYGTIGQPDAFLEAFGVEDNIVSAQWVKEQLASIKEKEVEIHITSNGGSVSEGYAIHDILKASGKTITTLGEGYVRSIATVIFLAGDKRLISPNADFTIHNPYIDLSFTGGLEAADVQKIANDIQQQEDKLAQFYSDATGKSLEDIKSKMKVETTMTAQEVVDFGFATGKTEQVKALAYLKISPTNNQMSKELKNELTGIKKILADLTAKFKGEVKAMTLTLKDGTKATSDSETALEVGQTVTREDGTLYDKGDIELEDGTLVTLDEKGVVLAIQKPEEDKTEEAKLKEEITALKAENKTLTEEAEAMKTEVEEVKASVVALGKLSSTYKAKAEQQTFGKGGKKPDAPVLNAVQAAVELRKKRAADKAASGK